MTKKTFILYLAFLTLSCNNEDQKGDQDSGCNIEISSREIDCIDIAYRANQSCMNGDCYNATRHADSLVDRCADAEDVLRFRARCLFNSYGYLQSQKVYDELSDISSLDEKDQLYSLFNLYMIDKLERFHSGFTYYKGEKLNELSLKDRAFAHFLNSVTYLNDGDYQKSKSEFFDASHNGFLFIIFMRDISLDSLKSPFLRDPSFLDTVRHPDKDMFHFFSKFGTSTAEKEIAMADSIMGSADDPESTCLLQAAKVIIYANSLNDYELAESTNSEVLKCNPGLANYLNESYVKLHLDRRD